MAEFPTPQGILVTHFIVSSDVGTGPTSTVPS